MIIAMNRNWSILNWNIRGIIDQNKWLVIRQKINEAPCDIICMQETKREVFDSRYIQNFYPRRINKYDYVASVGASGDIIIAWNDSFVFGETLFKNDYSL